MTGIILGGFISLIVYYFLGAVGGHVLILAVAILPGVLLGGIAHLSWKQSELMKEIRALRESLATKETGETTGTADISITGAAETETTAETTAITDTKE